MHKMLNFDNSCGYRTPMEGPIFLSPNINDGSSVESWNSIHTRSRRTTNFLFSEKNRLKKEKLWDKARNILFRHSSCGYQSLLDTQMMEKKVIDLFVEEIEKVLRDWYIPFHKINEMLYSVLSSEKEFILNYLGINYERGYLEQKICPRRNVVCTTTSYDYYCTELKNLLEEIIFPLKFVSSLIEQEVFAYPIVRNPISGLYNDGVLCSGESIVTSPTSDLYNCEALCFGESIVTSFIRVLTGQIIVVEPKQAKNNNSIHSKLNKDEFLEGITHCMQYRSSLAVVA